MGCARQSFWIYTNEKATSNKSKKDKLLETMQIEICCFLISLEIETAAASVSFPDPTQPDQKLLYQLKSRFITAFREKGTQTLLKSSS